MDRNITEKLKFYETLRIPVLGGLWYRFIARLELESIKKEKIGDYPLNKDKRDKIVIASLTSFPARIECAHYAIKSLMLQSYKPDRIVLWLAEEQFPEKKLPKTLLELQNYGLEIKWCENLYGHKKYFCLVSQQNENEVIITFDDDIIYPKKCIERLINTHQKFPNVLVCERAQAINFSEEKILNPGRWDTISDVGINSPSYSLNPSNGGGCLIPYGIFHEDITDAKKIQELALRNDDIWTMFMCVQNKTKIVKTRKYHKTFTVVEGSQVSTLASNNIGNGGYNSCMKRLIEAYPEAWKRIQEDSE